MFSENTITDLCISRLSEIHGIQVQLIENSSVGGGCINHARRIRTSVGDFFLKWNPLAPPDLFVKEAEGLKEMGSVDNQYIIIPQVVWGKRADEFPGLLLMEYLKPAGGSSVNEEHLGRGIANLHRIRAAKFGFHHSNYCGKTFQDNSWNSSWSEFFGNQRIIPLVNQLRVTRGLSSSELRTYERLVDRLVKLLSHETFPSLIHGDLWSGNFMFTEKGPALIDPACYYADREMELGMMQLFGGFSERVWSAYQEEFPLLPEWKDRIGLYQIYHVLNHYLLFGGSYGIQALQIAKSYL